MDWKGKHTPNSEPQSPLAGTTLFGSDPNNRVGELKGRFNVLSYMYYQQFKPSIKDRGFTNPNQ